MWKQVYYTHYSPVPCDKVDGRQDAEGATKAAVEESLKDAKAAKDQ